MGCPTSLDHRHRLARRVQEIAGDVAVVDRLDDHRDALAGEPLGGVAQIGDVDALALGAVAPLRPQPGHRVQQPALRRFGVDQRLLDAGAELRLAPRQRRHPALAGRPVAGRHVEQCLDQPVRFEPGGDGFGRMVVGAEIFDRLEAALGRGGKPVEKADFLKDEAQIGGEFRHGMVLPGRVDRMADRLFAAGAADRYSSPARERRQGRRQVPVLLGAIADDFTGATDLCNTLVRRGMRTVQLIDVPAAGTEVPDAEAVVVALKSRTIPAAEAIEQSLAALAWLRRAGARQILFKYCSTFDSTDAGNIGPVAEALMAALGTDFTLFCPAFPEAGRTIYRGYLFVGDVLLSESGMRDHPLTPMRDPSLVRVLQRQTTGRVGLVPAATVARGAAAIRRRLRRAAQGGLCPRDRRCDRGPRSRSDRRGRRRSRADHRRLGDRARPAGEFPPPWPARRRRRRRRAAGDRRRRGGAVGVVLDCDAGAGGLYAGAGAVFHDRPDRCRRRSRRRAQALAWAKPLLGERPILISARAPPEQVAEAQRRLGRERAGAVVEETLAAIARGLVAAGVRRLVVAGGETAGAVVQALGVTGLRIGRQIDPGVPWTVSLPRGHCEPALALALKSGNFGAPDFFLRAFSVLSGE